MKKGDYATNRAHLFKRRRQKRANRAERKQRTPEQQREINNGYQALWQEYRDRNPEPILRYGGYGRY
jgi:hypothetical protein